MSKDRFILAGDEYGVSVNWRKAQKPGCTTIMWSEEEFPQMI